MKKSSGYMLLFLVMVVTVLALGSSLAVIQQDTKLRRYTEQELKLNLDAIRRAFDLYQKDYPASAAQLVTLPSIASAAQRLAEAGYLRQSAWSQNSISNSANDFFEFRRNLVLNPSFEDDIGTISTDPWYSKWAVASDGIPDYWETVRNPTTQRIQTARQIIYKDRLPTDVSYPATFVVSFWGRWSPPAKATATFVLNVIREIDSTTLAAIAEKHNQWKRSFKSFVLPTLATLSIELSTNSNPNDAAYFDGIMLETWKGPATMTPFPSAWTKDFTFSSKLTSEALQQTQRLEQATTTDNLPAFRYLDW